MNSIDGAPDGNSRRSFLLSSGGWLTGAPMPIWNEAWVVTLPVASNTVKLKLSAVAPLAVS